LHAFDPDAVTGSTRGSIDNVDFIDGLPGSCAMQPTVVPRGAPLLVSGWTVDPVSDGRPQAVCVLLDRARPLDVHEGKSRCDIVVTQRSSSAINSSSQPTTWARARTNCAHMH